MRPMWENDIDLHPKMGLDEAPLPRHCPLSTPLLLSVPLNSFWSPPIQTWQRSHTADILSAPYCCHTQWYATISGCERDPAHCVPGIFSPTESMQLKSYTCNWKPFGFLIGVIIPEEVFDGIWLLCVWTSFPRIFGCDIFRLL